MYSRCQIRKDWVWKTKGNIFKSDHLFVTFLLKITFQSVVSKKSQDEIKNFLSYPICLVLLFRPSSPVEIRLRSKIESTVYGIGYSWARYCMWIIQDWKHKKLNTSANCHPTNEINQRLEIIISRKICGKKNVFVFFDVILAGSVKAIWRSGVWKQSSTVISSFLTTHNHKSPLRKSI